MLVICKNIMSNGSSWKGPQQMHTPNIPPPFHTVGYSGPTRDIRTKYSISKSPISSSQARTSTNK